MAMAVSSSSRIATCVLLLLVSWLAAPAAARVQQLEKQEEEEPVLIRQVTSSSSGRKSWWLGGDGNEEDSNLITSLPGAPNVAFSQSSGYITIDEAAGRALFFWFVEAEVADPASAPLTLWLNGGPGCSSIGGGALSELGPFYPNQDGNTLQVNPHSWNLVSNLLFLESPAGVGFSYSNTSSDYRSNDAKTAEDSYTFLVNFFAKYPGLADSKLYITGESYAGHYVPQLTQIIIHKNKELPAGQKKINLQGIAIGNAWTDSAIDNLGAAFYWWTHALISDETFYGITEKCDFSSVGPLPEETFDDQEQPRPVVVTPGLGDDRRECERHLDRADREMGPINIYEIYVDVCTAGHARKEALHLAKQLGRAGVGTRPLHKLLNATDAYDPCVDDEVEAYLNLPAVQAALHANVSGIIPWRWTDCSDILRYSYADVLGTVLPIYKELLEEEELQILIYSGDTDAIVPVTGSRSWIGALEREVKSPWRAYYVDHQVGGYVTVYDRLTFATVRGAGHMVPYTQPARALHLFRAFIKNGRF